MLRDRTEMAGGCCELWPPLGSVLATRVWGRESAGMWEKHLLASRCPGTLGRKHFPLPFPLCCQVPMDYPGNPRGKEAVHMNQQRSAPCIEGEGEGASCPHPASPQPQPQRQGREGSPERPRGRVGAQKHKIKIKKKVYSVKKCLGTCSASLWGH